MKSGFDRVLVTGETGFIGSHTVDDLLQKDAETLVLDNYLQGPRETFCIIKIIGSSTS